MTAAMTEHGVSARDALLAVLQDGPATPSELANRTGVNANAVRQALWRMTRAGDVESQGRAYALPRPTAQLAVPNPATVRPARAVASNGPSIDGDALLTGVSRYIDHFVKMPGAAALHAVLNLHHKNGQGATFGSMRG